MWFDVHVTDFVPKSSDRKSIFFLNTQKVTEGFEEYFSLKNK